MKRIAEGNNPHVVNLIGCVTIQEPLCLITEFVKYGDLQSYLRTNRRMVSSIILSMVIEISVLHSRKCLFHILRQLTDKRKQLMVAHILILES